VTTPASNMLMAVPVLDVEEVLARLPAQVRARVAWAQRPIEDALDRLRSQPLTDELIGEVADRIQEPLHAIGSAAWGALLGNHEESRALLMDVFRRDEELLARFLRDDDARDTLQWVVGLLRSFFNVFFSLIARLPLELLVSQAGKPAAGAGLEPEAKPFFGGLVALMASVREAKQRGDQGRAAELLDVCFLELREFRGFMLQHGVSLSAFPDETVAERHRRVLESVARLRKSFSDEDWRVLDEARVHDLR
jgi:hypothetical protein